MGNFIKRNIFMVVLIALGTISWSLTMVKSSLIYNFGAGFWGPNGHDGIWHISLIESIAAGSWGMPVFAGETIRNYHIGFDLLAAIIHKLTFIPVPFLYFQLLPICLAILIGFYVYRFVLLITDLKNSAFWSTFFVYFGGSFGWLVSLLRSGNLDGESIFWSQQSISTLVNPPFALSLVFIFAGLGYLIEGIRIQDKRKLILATFLFGLLVQIKVYGGILVLGGLLVSGIWEIAKSRNFVILKVFVGSLIISILVFSPLNGSSATQIVWQPFWFLENMMALSDRVGWERFYSAMNTYSLADIWYKAIPAYLVAFAIFIIGNFGTRVLSFLWLVKKFIKLRFSYIDIFIASIVSAGVVIPTLIVQSGSPWNTIQFVYYSLVFSGIIAGIYFSQVISSIKFPLKVFLTTFLVVITIPTSFATLYHHYLPGRPPAKIGLEELEALKFLSRQPQGIVLTYPFDAAKANAAQAFPPRPLYLYDSTAYVSAYSKKPVYLDDEVNLNITGYDWKTRKSELQNFYMSLDHNFVYDFLRDNRISYVYWLKGQRTQLGESQLGIIKIFENSSVDIYEVK